jgi:hypothetical protein
LGCNSQQDDTTSTPSIVNEASEPAVSKTDQAMPSVETKAVQRTEKDQAAERLKPIAMAFYEYNDHFGHFPPAASTDTDGNLLLSWRVHILPFLDAYDLYQQFHLDEPWNSDHNLTLVDQMPAIYQVTGAANEGETSLMVFTGKHAVFGGVNAESGKGPLKPFQPRPVPSNRQLDEDLVETQLVEEQLVDKQGNAPVVRSPLRGPTIRDLTDGTSNTILAVYAAPEKSVSWTKPEDLPFQPENPVAVLGEIPDDGFVALFWDSRVELLPKDIDPARLNSFIDGTEYARRGVLQEGEDPPIN